MPKDDLVYLGHMLDTARKVLEKVEGKTRAEYDRDENLRLALTHLTQIIGEAARRVSPGFQQAHPGIPWSDIIGMRHVLVHQYMRVDEDIVWQVATAELSPLVATLAQIVPPDEPSV
jgi:uncharacterized protein with HEPN domain